MQINLKVQASNLISFLLEAENLTIEELAYILKLPRTTLYKIIEDNNASSDILEGIYSFTFNKGYRLNSIKEDLLNETSKDKILFHGSKFGLTEINFNGARKNCDFGNGFYLGESYYQALAFVCENKGASIYSFQYVENNLNVLAFDCSLEWMLAICYFRGTIKAFEKNQKVQNIINKINKADLIIAPIADNRMFYIMSSFANGDINSEVALHSLSASKLGMQYIFKTEKALKCLKPIEKYYISEPEAKECIHSLDKRAEEIETKLKLAKREFRTGLYIEEILK